MRTVDHLALAHSLTDISNSRELKKYKWAFIAGCIEPDINVLTHARGMGKDLKFNGHNTEISQEIINRCIAKLKKRGLRSFIDYYRLGVLLHYTADAFTWPHNGFWPDGLAEHRNYEVEFHDFFTEKLEQIDSEVSLRDSSLTKIFESSYEAYIHDDHCMVNDFDYIIDVCKAMLNCSLETLTSRPVMA